MESLICVRVDGASNEGPSHEEVQFWWTLEYIESERVVTARSSGASYLNRFAWSRDGAGEEERVFWDEERGRAGPFCYIQPRGFAT